MDNGGADAGTVSMCVHVYQRWINYTLGPQAVFNSWAPASLMRSSIRVSVLRYLCFASYGGL